MPNPWTIRLEDSVHAPASRQGIGMGIKPAPIPNADASISITTTDPSLKAFAEHLASEEHDRLRMRNAGVGHDGGTGPSTITSSPPPPRGGLDEQLAIENRLEQLADFHTHRHKIGASAARAFKNDGDQRRLQVRRPRYG